MTCPACGEEERQDRKTVLGKARPLTLHRECLSGHAWHMPLVPQLLDDTEAWQRRDSSSTRNKKYGGWRVKVGSPANRSLERVSWRR
jgi:hypothetical protein